MSPVLRGFMYGVVATAAAVVAVIVAADKDEVPDRPRYRIEPVRQSDGEYVMKGKYY